MTQSCCLRDTRYADTIRVCGAVSKLSSLSFVSDLLIATRDARSETRTACSSHCNLTPTCWVAIRWWGCRNHFPKIIITKSNSNSNSLLRDEGFCLSNQMTKIADLPALINVDGAGRRNGVAQLRQSARWSLCIIPWEIIKRQWLCSLL